MIKYFKFIVILLILVQEVNAKSTKIDSTIVEMEKRYSFSTDDSSKISLLYDLSLDYISYDSKKSMFYAEELDRLAVKNGRLKDLALSNKCYGYIYYNLSNYDLALTHFSKANKIYIQLNDKLNQSRMLNNIGLIYNDKSNYTQAITSYYQSLILKQEMKDFAGVARLYNNIGNCYYDQVNLEKALDAYNMSLEISKGLNDKEQMSNSYNNLGIVHKKNKNLKKSLEFLEKSLNIRIELKDSVAIANSLANIGDIFTEEKQYEKAENIYFQSLRIYKRFGYKQEMAVLYMNIAEVKCFLKEYNQSKLFVEESIKLVYEINDKRLLIEAKNIKSKIFKNLGKFEKAYYELIDIIKIKDTLYKEESSKIHDLAQYKAVSEMLTKYEIEANQKKIELLQKQKEVQTLRLFLISAALFLSIVLIAFIWYNLRQKQRHNRILQVRNNEITLQKQKLMELDAMKSEVYSMVSHELRTPLTSVLGFAKIIKMRLNHDIFPEIKEESRNFKGIELTNRNLNIIIEEGERLVQMINQFLDIAKMEEGKYDWNIEPFNLEDIIDHCAETMLPMFEQKQIKFIKNITQDIPLVFGDKNRFKEVFINLFSNALKFTNEGSVTCLVEKTNKEIVVKVIDTGIGINSNDFNNLFKRFSQIPNENTTEKIKGSGLGLQICKQIVDYHGGKIWVESEEGKGASFSFTIKTNI